MNRASRHRSDLFDQQRTDVTRTIVFIRHDHPAASGSDENEIRMWYAQTLTAVGPNFIRHERRCAIQLTNGFYEHGSRMTCQSDLASAAEAPRPPNRGFPRSATVNQELHDHRKISALERSALNVERCNCFPRLWPPLTF